MVNNIFQSSQVVDKDKSWNMANGRDLPSK
jgi:hypothetical protein